MSNPREEIERLKQGPTFCNPRTAEDLKNAIRNWVLDDALAILDKWELAAEIVMPDHIPLTGFRVDSIERQMWNVINNSEPGDHILIIREKGG